MMEEFALLRLFKALESLTSPNAGERSDATPPLNDDLKPDGTTVPPTEPVNAMASLLLKHETLAARVKRNKL